MSDENEYKPTDAEDLQAAGIDPETPLYAYAITYLWSVPSQQMSFIPAIEGLWFKEQIDTTMKLRQAGKIIAMGMTANGAPSDVQVTPISFIRMPGDDTTIGKMQEKAAEMDAHAQAAVPKDIPEEAIPTVEAKPDGGVVVQMPERTGARPS